MPHAPRHLLPLDAPGGREAERRRGRLQPLGIAEARDPERVRVAGAGIRQPAGERIEHAVEHAEVHLGLGELGGEAVEQRAQRLVRRDRRGGVDAGGGHHQRHHQRRGEPVRGDVAQHDADTPAAQPREGVEVAADRLGGQASGGHLGVPVQHRGRRQQLELEIVGQLQLPAEPLLAQIALHQARVLDRGADLVGDGRDELAVARREAVAADAVGEVDDADAAHRQSRGAVGDGDAEVGPSLVAAIVAAVAGDVGRLLGVVDDGALLAEHLRRDRAVVVHPHRPQALQLEPARRDGAQHAGDVVEHHDGRPLRADHGAHLAHDGPGRLLELHRLPQDLADRVEEIDLLVAARQLLGDEAALPLAFEQGGDDRCHPVGRDARRLFVARVRPRARSPRGSPAGRARRSRSASAPGPTRAEWSGSSPDPRRRRA